MDKIKEIVDSIYREHYNMHRKGAYDFPDEDDWVKEQVKNHELNNPELYGYVWDEKNGDWTYKS